MHQSLNLAVRQKIVQENESHFVPAPPLLYLHQLDGEVQRGPAGDHALNPALAVAELRRDDEDPRLALTHARDAALVALDHLKSKCEDGPTGWRLA